MAILHHGDFTDVVFHTQRRLIEPTMVILPAEKMDFTMELVKFIWMIIQVVKKTRDS